MGEANRCQRTHICDENIIMNENVEILYFQIKDRSQNRYSHIGSGKQSVTSRSGGKKGIKPTGHMFLHKC